jgi:hypothetical protein
VEFGDAAALGQLTAGIGRAAVSSEAKPLLAVAASAGPLHTVTSPIDGKPIGTAYDTPTGAIDEIMRVDGARGRQDLGRWRIGST